jgi:catechol 2,3-dioxygenase
LRRRQPIERGRVSANNVQWSFASNPIGTFFDPARVYETLKGGIDFKTLQASIRAGQYVPATIPSIGLPV